MYFSCFLVKNMKKIIISDMTLRLIFILFLRFYLVPQKTLISIVQVKFCKAQIWGFPHKSRTSI